MQTLFSKTQIHKYPKILYVKQINNVASQTVNKECSRKFTQVVKNYKKENEFRAQAASMEPNFTNIIQENPFSEI